MIILALDTTAKTATCAILSDEKPIAVYTQNGNLTHSETMLNMIENMLMNAHMTMDDIEMLAVSVGPGSFTGVRIGVSIVKGLAFGRKLPCVPVSTLDALALSLSGTGYTGLIVPVMDARRQQVYTALYRTLPDGVLEKCTDDLIVMADALFELIRKSEGNPIFVGDGCDMIRQILQPEQGIAATYAPPVQANQNAYFVGLQALMRYRENPVPEQWTDASIVPTYLRASQAERERVAKEHGQSNM